MRTYKNEYPDRFDFSETTTNAYQSTFEQTLINANLLWLRPVWDPTENREKMIWSLRGLGAMSADNEKTVKAISSMEILLFVSHE